MKIRLFGRDLFEFKTHRGEEYTKMAYNALKDSKYLPDFKTVATEDWGAGFIEAVTMDSFVTIGDSNIITSTASGSGSVVVGTKSKASKETPKKKLTPKKVYQLQMLHNKEFKINMEPKYVDEQIKTFKEKLNLISTEEYDMRRGTEEIASILVRMENRKKYETVRKTFEQFPYTTNARIQSILKKHDYLKLGQVAQFIADMPKEATDTMKEYNAACEKLCGKKAVFYIVADKKDFKKVEGRRDPILLAQSPFGHFWQILGAWDDEMLFLDEL